MKYSHTHGSVPLDMSRMHKGEKEQQGQELELHEPQEAWSIRAGGPRSREGAHSKQSTMMVVFVYLSDASLTPLSISLRAFLPSLTLSTPLDLCPTLVHLALLLLDALNELIK